MPKLSFRNKILSVMVLLLLLSILASFLSARTLVEKDFYANDSQQIQTQLDLVSERVEVELQSAVKLANSIPLNLSNMAQVLDSSGFYRITKVMYGSVFSPDPSIEYQAGLAPTYLEFAPQQEQHYQAIATQVEQGASVRYVELVDDKLIMTIAIASIDSSGGIDIFEVNLQPILTSLEAIHSDAGGLELLTADGELLFSSVSFLEGNDTHQQPLLTKQIAVGDSTWALHGYLNQQYIHSHTDALVVKVALLSLVCGVVFIGLGLAALNVTYRPIIALRQLIEELGSGEADLTKRLEVHSSDDIGRISSSINSFVSNLQSLMQQVKLTSTSVAQQANELEGRVSSNQQQAVTHNQEIEKAVTAINEMSTAADGVATIASEAASVTNHAMTVSKRSQKSVEHAVTNVDSLTLEMENMSNSVGSMVDDVADISEVLNVIGGIAEQTNLLALNAAIEAARAGEQGRGFAVVADEVRALAARTQQSTEQISAMLAKLEKGSHQVVQALEETKSSSKSTSISTIQISRDLDDVTTAVHQLTDLNDSVAQSASEQKQVSEEINRNMHTLYSVVSELEENSQAAVSNTHTLLDKNRQLDALVGRFKIEKEV
jgi:methyl-accepting chemotaxis protein